MLATARRALVVWTVLACLPSAGQAQTPPPAGPTVVKAEPVSEWNAKFADKEGWIGGDAAYTAVLTRHRVLWLFGDSLLGTVKDGKRTGAVMVNNTVGVQSGHDTNAAIRFVAGKARDGKPAAIFTPADGKGWLWPQAAIGVGDRLFVFLPQIDKSTDPGVFGFRHIGQWLAVIDNAEDEPLRWRVKQHPLPFARFGPRQVRSWGSAVLSDGEWLYVYGYQEQGKQMGSRKLLVARVPAAKLADFAAWRFRAPDGWSEKSEDAAPLTAGLATEFSVSRLPNRKGYLLVYTENGLGDRIVGRFAKTAAGPWSDPVLLYRCPEMARDKGVFCYAAKAHPWAANGDELLLSYCVNTWEFARLFRDDKVYRPQFVRVKLGPAK
jgi:hypothetical protein